MFWIIGKRKVNVEGLFFFSGLQGAEVKSIGMVNDGIGDISSPS
jgi:hypothetical protein